MVTILKHYVALDIYDGPPHLLDNQEGLAGGVGGVGSDLRWSMPENWGFWRASVRA